MQNCIETRHSLLESSPKTAIRDYLGRNGYWLRGPSIKKGMSLKTTVSVVIPVYNEMGVVDKTLQVLKDQLYSNFEVVVVDNASTDETYRIVESFGKNANYSLCVISEKNPGVAYARKRGMDEVLLRLLKRGGDFHHFLAVTDADTIPPRDWIKKIIEGFKQDEIGGLAGTHEASEEVEKRIEEVVGIRNYFNIIPLLIEFLEENGIGGIKMSGPNSAFSPLAYALGNGIRQEYDEDGKTRLSEVNNLGNRIKRLGYTIAPMKCRVIKNRRRELFELINGGENSYFPRGYLPHERFNVIRGDETKLLDIACEQVPKEDWIKYRYNMISKVLKNFNFLPLASGKITIKHVQRLFSPEEIEFFLDNSNFEQLERNSFKMFEKFLSGLEGKLYHDE